VFGALLAVANGEPFEFLTGSGTGVAQPLVLKDLNDLRSHFRALLTIAATDRVRLANEFQPIGIEVLTTVKPRMVIQVGADGFTDRYVRDFRTLKSALSYAVMLLLNLNKPFGAALCQCRLSDCGRFYAATKNPKGGPANRNYCSAEHRAIAHDRKENRSRRRRK
jgi:hypothetical protein